MRGNYALEVCAGIAAGVAEALRPSASVDSVIFPILPLAEQVIFMNRMPELRDLSDDHHNGLVLARKAKRATADQVAKIWREVECKFQAELAIHFAIEEDCLVEPMRAVGEAALADQLVDEHRHLRALVTPNAPRTAEALEQFGLALERHIRFEERTFFEVAQQKLSSETLTAVAEACKLRGGT